MLISDIVKEILETNNLSQEKLAKILKVSQKSIRNWLRGVDMPKSRSILSFYEKFGITPNELMGLEEPKSIELLKEEYLKNLGWCFQPRF